MSPQSLARRELAVGSDSRPRYSLCGSVVSPRFHFFYPIRPLGTETDATPRPRIPTMQARLLTGLFLFAAAAAASLAVDAQDFRPDAIIALEGAALDRWSDGDPRGYLETFAENVTYFDPTTDGRVDGIEAMRARLAPLTGQFKLMRYEILAPDVIHRGGLAVLSYNLVTYGSQPGGERIVTRWNVTSAYVLIDGAWRITHSHFSLTQPQSVSVPAP
jgi:ketosteroid isomerase-like protein